MVSSQIASVKDAVELGADAVGYTVYVVVEEEPLMLQQIWKVDSQTTD